MAVITRYFTQCGSFWNQLLSNHSLLLKLDAYCQRQKCSPDSLVFSNMSFMCDVARYLAISALAELLVYSHVKSNRNIESADIDNEINIKQANF